MEQRGQNLVSLISWGLHIHLGEKKSPLQRFCASSHHLCSQSTMPWMRLAAHSGRISLSFPLLCALTPTQRGSRSRDCHLPPGHGSLPVQTGQTRQHAAQGAFCRLHLGSPTQPWWAEHSLPRPLAKGIQRSLLSPVQSPPLDVELTQVGKSKLLSDDRWLWAGKYK